MTAQEARNKALDIQKDKWSKLSLEVRNNIRHFTECGQLHCIINNELDNMEIYNLKALGYNVRDIVEDTFEISW